MLLVCAFALADDTLTFTSAVPVEGDFFSLPFDVPEGTVEIEVAHAATQEGDILDFGLLAPSGFRGWGGGNTENAVVGELAASRSYLAGPIEPGTWEVLVGKAKLTSSEPGYTVTVTLRTTATLPPEPARRPYTEADLGGDPRWYAGDFHVHSEQSGDATPTLDEVAAYASERGLDFVELSEHNTTAALDWVGDTQDRFPELLLLPGMEITTYAGHANGIGLTTPVPFAMGWEGADFAATAEAVEAAGAVLSINHPELDLGELCIGCAWEHEVPSTLGAFEIATGGYDPVGVLFHEATLARWDALCDAGPCPAAIGGSDDHRAGTATGPLDSPIGSPTTMVYGERLSPSALLAGIRAGRTVVKLQGPDDPMIDLSAEGTTATAQITGALGGELRWVEAGALLGVEAIDADPFSAATPFASRLRAEVWLNGAPRTITSHIFPAGNDEAPPCGCRAGVGNQGWLAVAAAWLLARGRRVHGV